MYVERSAPEAPMLAFASANSDLHASVHAQARRWWYESKWCDVGASLYEPVCLGDRDRRCLTGLLPLSLLCTQRAAH